MKTPRPIMDRQAWLDALDHTRQPFHDAYLAMYSSVWDGIVTDPMLMLIPADDHVVHRGDGIFETLKCVQGKLYNAEAHMDRFHRSAEALCLDVPYERSALVEILAETVRAGNRRTCAARLLLSRGTGGMGANPYEAKNPHLYVLAYRLGAAFMDNHPGGARAGLSRVPPKPGFHATVKSCNYLANVMMAREAVDRGLDFVIGEDEQGHLTEGATENFALVTSNGHLVAPRAGRLLEGTTLQRVLELARATRRTGLLQEIEKRPLTAEDLYAASEMLIIGTTRDVLPVVEFEGRRIGTGLPGPVFRDLADRLHHDILANDDLLTPVF